MLRTTKKFVVIALCIGLVLSMLAGCGGQKGDVDTSDKGEGSKSGTSDSQEVVLQWWDCDSREDWVKATQKPIDDFTAENPNIKIERVLVPFNDIDKKLQAAGAADTRPDLLYAYHVYHSAWAYQGHTIPLDDVIDNIGRDTFYEAHLRNSTVDGKTYAVPFEFHPHIMYYRKDLYEKYNLSIPKTWEELYDNAKTIMENEDDVYGFMVYNGLGNPYILINLMGVAGAATFDQDGNIIINSPETIAALEFEKKMIEMTPPGSLAKSSTDLRLPFIQGQAAHMLDSTSLADAIYKENKMDQFSAFAMPNLKGDKQTMNDFGGWAVSKTASIDEAKKFLEFFYQKEQFMYYSQYEVIGHLPANKIASESDEFWNHERMAPFQEMFKEAIKVAENGVGMGMTYGPNKYAGAVRSMNIWDKMVDMMALQDKSPEEVAEWAQNEIEQIKKDIDAQ